MPLFYKSLSNLMPTQVAVSEELVKIAKLEGGI
jgi:hypothetical protein